MLGPSELPQEKEFVNPLDLSAPFLAEAPLPAPQSDSAPLPVEADPWPEEIALGSLSAISKKLPSRHHAEEELSPALESLQPRREWIEIEGGESLDYGDWWHETLRLWPWGSETETFAAEAVRNLSEGPWRERGARELEAFRRSALHPALTALSAAQRLQEIPYTRSLEGAIEDGLDWKTDAVSGPEAEFIAGLKERHGPQLHAYREALTRLFPGMRVERCQVYSTVLGATVWV
jgi:ATP-dependent exoDNAse (exonuclease V) beta subunit